MQFFIRKIWLSVLGYPDFRNFSVTQLSQQFPADGMSVPTLQPGKGNAHFTTSY